MRNPPHILIVDDNPANRDIFETRLAVHGYEIYTASDGEEGLALARERRPDLILLDVMMPKMDGIEVCQHLKGDGELPFIPIILVTAKSDPKDVVAGLEAGADEYLTKPVDQTALVARVKSMLRIKALYDQTPEQSGRRARHLERDAAAEGRRAAHRARDASVRSSASSRPSSPSLSCQHGKDRVHGEPPARDHRRVLRPARLHLVLRDRRAGGGHARPARVPPGGRPADLRVRGNARALSRETG